MLNPEQEKAIREAHTVLDRMGRDLQRSLAAFAQLPRFDYPDIQITSTHWQDLRQRLTGVAETIERQSRDAWPANWDEDIDLQLLLQRAEFIGESGIPLVWVPRGSIVAQLTSVDSTARRQVLLDAEHDVVADCRTRVQALDDEPLGLPSFVTMAIDAFVDGHAQASQALAVTVLDTFLRQHRGLSSAATVRVFNRVPEEETLTEIRSVMVHLPVYRCFASFWPPEPIPSEFNRHATVHGVSYTQFTRENALLALMLITSVLCEEQAVRTFA